MFSVQQQMQDMEQWVLTNLAKDTLWIKIKAGGALKTRKFQSALSKILHIDPEIYALNSTMFTNQVIIWMCAFLLLFFYKDLIGISK